MQQIMSLKYFGVELPSKSDTEEEVHQQVLKGTKIAGCLSDTIWQNKHLQRETKLRIYQAAITPIMMYATKT